MLHLNRLHINESSVFSLEWWKWSYATPNLYLADGIKDFLDSKQEIEPTPEYVGFISRNRSIGGWAVVSIMGGCTYERKYEKEEWGKIAREAKEKSITHLEQLKQRYSSFLFDDRRYEQFQKEADQIIRTYAKEVSNSVLYNATGTLDVKCSVDLDIPHCSYHLGALLTYNPKYGVVTLDGVYSSEDFNRPQKEKLSLADLVSDLLPLGDPLPQPG